MNFEVFLSPAAWLTAFMIFGLRVLNMSFDTVRVLFIVRGYKLRSWIVGFIQSIIFVLIIGSVLTQLDNPLNLIAYAAGFATGNVVGIRVSEALRLGHTHVTIYSSNLGSAVAEQLRANEFAVTEIPGRGKDGVVMMLHCDISRKKLEKVEELVRDLDPSAFITAEEVRPIRRGFWGIS
jgi:uncharacterized protein YebE (UPF0316 family)